MNLLLLACGLYAGFVACVHIFLGGKTILAPTLGARFDGVAKQTMHACWHVVSVNLVLFSAVLLWMGVSGTVDRGLTAIIAAHMLLYSGVFVAVALKSSLKRALLELPQWGLLAPLGLALLWS